jgi:curved DNA-binding protein CbpA
MSRTFYGVLGVGPDADEETIRAAYRERVKEHHPDVSSDPDATDRFKRVTAAKETLLDAADRARYDRLGHRAYVKSHADSTLWASDRAPGPTASSSRGSTTGVSDSRDATTDSGDRAAGSDDRATSESRTRDATDGPSRSDSTGPWTGRTEANRGSSGRRGRRRTGERTRSDGARRSWSSQSSDGAASNTDDDTDGQTEETASDRSTGSNADPGSSRQTGSTEGDASNGEDAASNGGGRSAGEDPSNADEEPGGDGTKRTGSGATASGRATDERASETAEAGTASETTEAGTASGAVDGGTARADPAGRGPESGDRRRRRGNGRTVTDQTGRSRRSSTGSYATTSFWGVAADRPSAERSSNPAARRVFAALRRLGPWILVHALFLSLSVGTGWYVYTVVLPPAERSVALLFVLIGEVGLAVVLSSLHILSRLYR